MKAIIKFNQKTKNTAPLIHVSRCFFLLLFPLSQKVGRKCSFIIFDFPDFSYFESIPNVLIIVCLEWIVLSFLGQCKVEIVSLYLCIDYHVSCVSVFLSSYLISIICVTGRFVQNAGFTTGEAMTHSDFYLEIVARKEDVPSFETSQ